MIIFNNYLNKTSFMSNSDGTMERTESRRIIVLNRGSSAYSYREKCEYRLRHILQ
jgi:hypothetical protein